MCFAYNGEIFSLNEPWKVEWMHMMKRCTTGKVIIEENVWKRSKTVRWSCVCAIELLHMINDFKSPNPYGNTFFFVKSAKKAKRNVIRIANRENNKSRWALRDTQNISSKLLKARWFSLPVYFQSFRFCLLQRICTRQVISANATLEMRNILSIAVFSFSLSLFPTRCVHLFSLFAQTSLRS